MAHFYVSVVDPINHIGHVGRLGLLAGPFGTHAEALAMVDAARIEAEKADVWAVFYSFGTVKMETGERAGVLNERLGIAARMGRAAHKEG